MIIAHRGYYDDFVPENSIESFKRCLVRNIAIELDVRKTLDKKLVVFHDKNLLRMTGINKNIEKTLYSEIKELKLLKSKENIPLLEDVLKLVNDKVLLLIEIKSKNIEKQLNSMTKKYNKIYFQAFDEKVISKLKKLSNKKVGLLTFGYKKKDYYNKNIDFISVKSQNINNVKTNKEIFLWNINDYEELQKYKNYDYHIVYLKNVIRK